MTATKNPFVPPKSATQKRISHVAIVLDRSGSMEECRDATISGFNEYRQHIRRTAEEENFEARLTFTVFNDEVKVKHVNAPIDRLRRLERTTYVPDGTTAMLDAVGETIDRLESDIVAPDGTTFLVCVVSDGLENASRRYTYEQIAERIKRLTATERWTFTYLGSNQDLSDISSLLHIPEGNIASYDATPAGTSDAWQRHASATVRRMRRPEHEIPEAGAPFYTEEERK